MNDFVTKMNVNVISFISVIVKIYRKFSQLQVLNPNKHNGLKLTVVAMLFS